MLNPTLRRVLSSLVVVLFFSLHLVGILRFAFIERMENLLYDARLTIRMPHKPDPRIVIVDIDEKSLAAEGRWPWHRDRLARMVDLLFDRYQVSVLGFDVVFAEADPNAALKLLRSLARGPLQSNEAYLAWFSTIRPTLEYDRIFAESLQNRPVIMGYYFRTPLDRQYDMATGKLPPPVLTLREADENAIPFVVPRGYGGNLPELQAAAAGGGFFDNPLIDGDGIYRRMPVVQKYQGELYESLPLAVTRAVLDFPPLHLQIESETRETAEFGLERIAIGGLEIPVDERGAVLIPYRGRQGSFPYVSATDILTGQARPDVLKNAIVLVGSTTIGLKDLRSTPVQNVFPGVEIHANLISGFLDQRIKHQPGYTLGIEFITLLCIGLIMSMLLPRLPPMLSLLSTLLILCVTVWLNLFLWSRGNLVVPLASSLLLILVLFILHMSFGFFVEASGKKKIAGLFEQYVPPELVDEMSKNPSEFGVAGESREMTVLFLDIRNFTSISENMPPQQLTLLLNHFFTALTRIIYDHRGTVDKYMGDAVMAFWGAPMADEEHCRHALDAAIEMANLLPDLRQQFRDKGWPEVDFGIGLNTGLMNVGNMGSEYRMTYTVVGDAVNLGSRLETLTKQYGVTMLVSEFLKNRITGFVFQELDRVRVPGREEPLTIFEAVGRKETVPPSEIRRIDTFHRMLNDYRNRRWDAAEEHLQNLLREDPSHKLYRIYLERIRRFRQFPPGASWDGVASY